MLRPRALSTIIGILVCLLMLAWSAATRAAQSPPNVLLIMTDDQGWGDIGRHGNDQIRTPTLDALHDASVRFERFFVSPVCAPTRAGLLTGRYPVRTGVTGVTQRYEVMRADEVTLAEVFQANNYVTGCFGKWHNGEQYPNHPRGQGFDEFFGFCGGHWNNYFDAKLESAGEPVATSGYITDVLTDAALEFIDAHSSAPFFCYVPYNAPHTPWQVSDRYFDQYAGQGLPTTTACAYAMVQNIDDNVDRLLKRLEERGLRDHTIVIFLTDNGPNSNRYSGDMRGRKGSVHEGGVRVPCFVSWPTELTPKSVSQIAAHIDILPTLAELCGLALPETKPLDGKSLAPLMRSTSDDAVIAHWPDRNLFTYRPTQGRQGRKARGAVRSQQYRYVTENSKEMLFDMVANPSQSNDISAAHPEVFKMMQAAYQQWVNQAVPTETPRVPIPVGSAAAPRVELPSVEAQFSGNPEFHNQNGYAHDWITNWTAASDRIWWTLDVAKAGDYDVVLSYACAKQNTGSEIRLSVLSATAERSTNSADADTANFTIADAFDTGKIARPERDLSSGTRWVRDFQTMNIGRVHLPAGRVRLELRATDIRGDSVCELDALKLQRTPTSDD